MNQASRQPKIPNGSRRVLLGEALAAGDRTWDTLSSRGGWVTTGYRPGTILTASILRFNGVYIRRVSKSKNPKS